MNEHAGKNLQEKRPATGAVDHEQMFFLQHKKNGLINWILDNKKMQAQTTTLKGIPSGNQTWQLEDPS